MDRPDDSLMETVIGIGGVQHPNVYEGDLVEARISNWPDGHVMRGKAVFNQSELVLGNIFIVAYLDRAIMVAADKIIRVIERAVRPFYTNATRTASAPGDVFRLKGQLWVVKRLRSFGEQEVAWHYNATDGWVWQSFDSLPSGPKVLLVNGITGEPVNS